MVAAPLIMSSMVSVASAADDGFNIFSDMKFKGEIRPRYEMADVDKPSTEAANAFTARTTLSLTAGLFEVEGLTSTVGIQTVNNFGYTNYNSTQNGNTQYDIIADPQQAMLSEASIDYKVGKTSLHAGRSHVNLDNQRFIGTVGWRQSERSYDTVYVANNDVENLNVMAAYVYGYAGVKSVTTTDTSSVLLNAKYKVMDELSITGYGYLLASKTDTYGVALTGKIDAGAKLSYRAEYAVQKDPSLEYQTADVKADATYMNFDLGANFSGVLAGLNYESLSGKDGADTTAFNPALGTNHKFNGWADVFYVGGVPTDGLLDANARLGYKAKGFGKVLAVYHDFKSDVGSKSYGTEIDAVYVNKVPGVTGLTGLIKAAFYQAGDKNTGFAAADTDKTVFWAQLDYKF